MSIHLAVDIGASSGRHILGTLKDGQIALEEVYRFENRLEHKNGRLCWDLDRLFDEIINGLKACKEIGKLPDTMGIDTWGVDYVLLDEGGCVLGDTVAYRDSRTAGMDVEVETLISPEELYEKTGIQKQSYNTIYQLMAVKKTEPELLSRAKRFLMVPDYLHYRLTGKCSNEYTEATTTGMVNAQTKAWDYELLESLGYPCQLFGKLSMPGETLGGLSPDIQGKTGFDCQVILPATHDTGSAFLAVPVKDEYGATLSSGTWSLLGVENPEPITSEESRLKNFTNEGGFQYRFRYLKNIMGLWMIQSVRRELSKEKPVSFAELEKEAIAASSFVSRVEVNAPCFLAPESMCRAVREYCSSTGQPVPETTGQLMACIYQSLAQSYKEAIMDLELLTGRKYRALNIVGGGSKDGYLNQLTSDATGLPVYAGPAEGTALGNLLVQMIACGELTNVDEARKAVRHSFSINEYKPNK